jgi:hypothetical protein
VDFSDISDTTTSFYVRHQIEGVMMPFVASDESGACVPLFMKRSDAETMVSHIRQVQVGVYDIVEVQTLLAIGLLHAGNMANARAAIVTPNDALRFWGPSWFPKN